MEISEKQKQAALEGVQIIKEGGFVLMKDPQDPQTFYIQLQARPGKEEDLEKVLLWLGSFISDPYEQLKKTFWDGKQE